jgi:PTH1 family peptidyl-tRNA hydrolase
VEYAHTRHNVGFAWVDNLARQTNSLLRLDAKFHGMTTKIRLHNQDLYLLEPQTFMNLSGRSVLAIAQFYKILPDEMLIVHDELDLPIGMAKLKFDGGHGGHNGLRDISAKLASTAFWRLRLGIGHPGHKTQVANYVLKPAARDEQISIDLAIDRALSVLPEIMRGDFSAAMQKLHSL